MSRLVRLDDGTIVDPAVFDIWARDTSVPMSQDDIPKQAAEVLDYE